MEHAHTHTFTRIIVLRRHRQYISSWGLDIRFVLCGKETVPAGVNLSRCCRGWYQVLLALINSQNSEVLDEIITSTLIAKRKIWIRAGT